jgi:hypothetical protein
MYNIKNVYRVDEKLNLECNKIGRYCGRIYVRGKAAMHLFINVI